VITNGRSLIFLTIIAMARKIFFIQIWLKTFPL
jgi:hypothetical protein